MRPEHADTKAQTLREHLRKATSHSHDMLDASMRPASDWQSSKDYVRFLSAQHSARLPVEAWLSQHAPEELRPPEQTPLLKCDLEDLGHTAEPTDDEFDLEYKGESTAIGVAWVLAGSSLGNRAMLGDMKRALPKGTDWPHDFLSSRAMTSFWKGLRARVEAPAEMFRAHEASRAATAVFEHFLKVAREGPGSAARALEGAG